MTKGTKIYMGICAVIFICTIAVGVATRFSFKGSTTLRQLISSKNVNKYTTQILEDDDANSVFCKVSNYKQLEKKSEFIAKVKVTDDRKLYMNSTNTKVMVEEIYKSNIKLAKNDIIYVYEPANFEEEFNIFDSLDGYQLMADGKEYYVFLNGLKTAEGYKKSEKEKKTFVPSTTKFSVYSVENDKQRVLSKRRLDGDGEGYSYGEIKDLRLITAQKNEMKTYNNIKTEINSRLLSKCMTE